MNAVVVAHPSSISGTLPHRLPANPFVGLRPFEAEDSLLFFGRREQCSELLRRLHKTRFLAVVGSSGCGKSSLVRAGLIPALQAGFLVEERDHWIIGKMKPGDAPLTNLVTALEPKASPAEAVSELVLRVREGGARVILTMLAKNLEQRDSNLLLLVDQFEEIFRFHRAGRNSEEAEDFVAIMLELAAQRELPVYVVLTMRSDFLGDCDMFCGLPEAMNVSQYLVPRLRREQRREAIEGPVRLYRQEIAPRLIDRLLNETIDTRDDLPVLQHALMRTWDYWQHQDNKGPLDFPHYEAVGTIHSALSQDAEAALIGMEERQLLLTKRLFQALTTVDSSNRGVRRPAKLAAIAARCETGKEEIQPIIDRFLSDGRSFLIVTANRPGADPLIDISHESLIRQWKRLGDWVLEEAESVRTFRRLAESARLYQGRPEKYRDQELQMALEWQAQENPNPTWARDISEDFARTMKFLAAAKAVRDQEWAEGVFKRRFRYLRAVIIGIVFAMFYFNMGWKLFGIEWEAVDQKIEEMLAQGADENEPHLVEAIKNIPILLKFTAHAVVYFVLIFLARTIYRRFAFKSAIDKAKAAIHDPSLPSQQNPMVKIVQILKAKLPRLVEGLAKWVSILGGISILGSCSLVGFTSGAESGLYSTALGLVVAAFLVGWVFAVARLNAEVREIRDTLERSLEGKDRPT